ncbi:D-aspartate oxidase isoform X1 [Protopterus annectens]|uniref:D-aspartate oxidase isoform X1 n=2 Tax=Protopterus annectens TaxID=7888 RepID=UPI001CFA5FB9|nr:D-aspartate oxidase isoform X1 [Protopterus annectens]XP_043922602.1 D-aspartate oxidase isoform X1 [Protopterus annectens]
MRRKIAVIGAGVVGLSTAVCIAESLPDCSVTVISEKFSPDTTSDVAAGILIPKMFPETPLQLQKSWFKTTFDYLLGISKSHNASDAGVHMLFGWHLFKEIPSEEYPFWHDVVMGFRPMTDEELAQFPGYKFGQAFMTMKCECTFYLPWMVKRLKSAGGQIQKEKVTDFWDLHGKYDLVVNCTGIGSRELAGDMQLYPMRGLAVQVRAPWLKHFVRVSDGQTYMYPGRETVTLGGTTEKDNWSLKVDPITSQEVFERCCNLEPSLRKCEVVHDWVGLRPTRASVRLEKEVLKRGEDQLTVIHNYGHSGCGISIHWGTAWDATQLVKECVIVSRMALKAKM